MTTKRNSLDFEQEIERLCTIYQRHELMMLIPLLNAKIDAPPSARVLDEAAAARYADLVVEVHRFIDSAIHYQAAFSLMPRLVHDLEVMQLAHERCLGDVVTRIKNNPRYTSK